jgi:CBS domain-containing protein
MKIAEILSRKPGEVRTTRPDARVDEVIGRLEEFGVGSLVVLEDRQVIGVLTERDLVRGYARHGASAGSRPVRALMSPPLLCAPDDDVVPSPRR